MPQHLDRKLAVILHADIIESTRLVQQDEALAHKRIVETFKRFASNIEEFDGVVHEIRGDALLAVFPRASDAVNAALTFQQQHKGVIAALDDGIRPELRVGIAMGEVIIADGTMTGGGVVLAQRLEQLCDAGEVVIQGAVYETLPRHLPMKFENLGDQKLKGFEEVIRAHRAEDRILATSFDEPTRQAVINLLPDVVSSTSQSQVIQARLRTWFGLPSDTWSIPPEVVALQIPPAHWGFALVTPSMVRLAKRRGLEVHVWTINSPEDMKRLWQMGVHGIVTDRSDLAVKVRGELFPELALG